MPDYTYTMGNVQSYLKNLNDANAKKGTSTLSSSGYSKANTTKEKTLASNINGVNAGKKDVINAYYEKKNADNNNKITYTGGNVGTTAETVDTDTANAFYEALMSRWNDATEKRNSYLNALYADNQKDINGRYSRLKRALNRKAVNNGQDPYVTNAWNIDYAKDTSQRELDKSKLEAEATNASNDYSVYSSLYNSLLNSNASNATKKKLLGYA